MKTIVSFCQRRSSTGSLPLTGSPLLEKQNRTVDPIADVFF